VSRSIRIKAGDLELVAELNDSDTARLVYDELPIRGAANRWGEEIYFEVPIDAPSAGDARDVMEIGELAYWPPGRAFCIFFGRTPASEGDEPRAASAVNPLGTIRGDASALTAVRSGTDVVLEKL
jgi:hypothetical protein